MGSGCDVFIIVFCFLMLKNAEEKTIIIRYFFYI